MMGDLDAAASLEQSAHAAWPTATALSTCRAEQALKVYERLDEHRDRGLHLRSMARLYREAGDLPTAVHLAEAALNHFKAIEYPAAEASTTLDLAQLSHESGDTANVAALLRKASSLAADLYRHDKARILLQLEFVKRLVGESAAPGADAPAVLAPFRQELRETLSLFGDSQYTAALQDHLEALGCSPWLV
jgi:hypothetical protein